MLETEDNISRCQSKVVKDWICKTTAHPSLNHPLSADSFPSTPDCTHSFSVFYDQYLPWMSNWRPCRIGEPLPTITHAMRDHGIVRGISWVGFSALHVQMKICLQEGHNWHKGLQLAVRWGESVCVCGARAGWKWLEKEVFGFGGNVLLCLNMAQVGKNCN